MFHVVDDQPYLCEILSGILEFLECEVETFTSPHDYLDYATSDKFIKPIATFTDVHMPTMNGYEMIGRLLQVHPYMKFVVISGESTIKHKSMDQACIYLLKPFKPEIIETVVYKLRQCSRYGPSQDIGCANCGDREDFLLSDWLCPKDTDEVLVGTV